MTFISVLVLLTIGGFFTLLLLKLGPIYLENYKVRTVLANLEAQSGSLPASASKIREAVARRLYINEVRRFSNKDIKIKREDRVMKVMIDYEVREKILANVDALVTFHEKAEFKIH